MGKNSSLVDNLLDEESTTSTVDETAVDSITVKGKKVEYYRGFCNIRVDDADLDAFHKFVGRDNYDTFSVRTPLDPKSNVKVPFTITLDDNGYPIGYNEELHNEASYKIALNAMSARRV